MIKIKKRNPTNNDNTFWNGYNIGESEKNQGYKATDDYYNSYVAYLGFLIEKEKFTSENTTLEDYRNYISGYLSAYDKPSSGIIYKIKKIPIIHDSIRSLYFIKANINPLSHKGLNQNKYYTKLILQCLIELNYIQKSNSSYELTDKGFIKTSDYLTKITPDDYKFHNDIMQWFKKYDQGK